MGINFLKQELLLTKKEVSSFAKEVAKALEIQPILCLKGDLGTGKTFFTSKLIQHLTEDANLNITSPTFNIANIYKTKTGKSIYHFDLYRIKNFEELENTGFFEAIHTGICIIEWWDIFEERIIKFLKSPLFIDILYVDEKQRRFFYG
jgi:tRNA threonylcarbamoyl adenosine modification protein YjeE